MNFRWLAAMRARLVDDVRQLHRFYSVRAAAIGAVLLTAWTRLPDDVKALLPGWLSRLIAYAVLLAVVAGAATKQTFKGDANG